MSPGFRPGLFDKKPPAEAGGMTRRRQGTGVGLSYAFATIPIRASCGRLFVRNAVQASSTSFVLVAGSFTGCPFC
jgi:hypothetical protein